ncbi:MAG: hypothetical protein JWR80_9627 [Bradyrhizobium sp.]|nr:hypothetical protein [Bradyrhizobium sp.]
MPAFTGRLCHRPAHPGLTREDVVEAFTEGPVEAGIVGDDEIGGFNDGPNRCDVEHLALDHFVCDAGETRDLNGDWCRWLLQASVNGKNVANLALFIEREDHQADFDDFVLAGIETCCLGVDDDASQREAGTT